MSTGRLFAPFDTNPSTRFAGLLSQELLDKALHLREVRADLLAIDEVTPELSNSIATVELDIQDIEADLARREKARIRLGNDVLAPRAPCRNDKLMDLARDLQAMWPIDRFCEDLMAVRLNKSGRSYRAQCPIPGHDDRSPSFVIYPDEGRFHCFGCGAHGDIYDLAGHYFGLGRFADQVRMVADATGEWMERTA